MVLLEVCSLKVVSRIRASGEACVLLVADKECDTWHRLCSSQVLAGSVCVVSHFPLALGRVWSLENNFSFLSCFSKSVF